MTVAPEHEFFITAAKAVDPRPAERLRLAVPDPLVPAVVRARAAVKRRRGGALALARREMGWLLGAVADDAEVEAVAQRYLVQDTYRSEARWHPGLICHQPVDGIEHLAAARAEGRGVVISFLHHGHYEGAVASVSAADRPIHVALSPDMCGPDAPGFLRQHVRAGVNGGTIGVNVAGGAGVLAGVLARGEVLAIATDVPGTMPADFLGQQRYGSSGAARLALGTRSLVVVMTAHRSPSGELRLSIGEPIEPTDFASPDDLVRHLLAAQEDAVRAWPEGYHHPTLRWGTAPRVAAD
ncbi:hypothetical protein [Nocardioides litoris]|uniref:hypothetical protein n=1 Tax=Nocardioides litoris TaxID=1926648 RepID=UPI0011243BCD|nr:hypothetical protein [Nocardioides litoris]